MSVRKADDWIRNLGLVEHGNPCMGYFSEVHRSKREVIRKGHEGETRSALTSIHFLQKAGQFGYFHALRSDEIFFYHAGAPLHILILDEEHSEQLIHKILGPDAEHSLQVIVPSGKYTTQFVEADDGSSADDYSLASIAVAPGFEVCDDFVGKRDQLLEKFPDHKEVIVKYTNSK